MVIGVGTYVPFDFRGLPTCAHLLNFLTVCLICIWHSQEMDVHCLTCIFYGFNSFSKEIMMDNSYLLIQWKFVLHCENFEVINTGYICYKLD